MNDADIVLRRASEVLDRSQIRQTVERGARSAMIRVRRAAITAFAI